MWKQNFLFHADESAPIEQTENELFHDTDPALDSSGLELEKFVSVWIQGDGEDAVPVAFTNVYVRTATLDPVRRVGFLQPLQGRAHQIRKMLSAGQKTFLRDWLHSRFPDVWREADDHFQRIFDAE